MVNQPFAARTKTCPVFVLSRHSYEIGLTSVKQSGRECGSFAARSLTQGQFGRDLGGRAGKTGLFSPPAGALVDRTTVQFPPARGAKQR